MKRSISCLVLLAAFCLQAFPVAAQSGEKKPVRYNFLAYMKVKPGMYDDYLKLEKAWKKIHMAAKKAGKLDDWSLAEVVSPQGTANEYDFVCRNSYLGEAAFAAAMDGGVMGDNWASMLTPDEIALVMRTDQIRDMVKTEVWSNIDGVFSDDMDKTAKIFVWNYFTSPAGKTRADHEKVELDIWKPVHAMRLKEGKMKGWALLNMEMPGGAALPYEQATVDIYESFAQYWQPWTDDYVKKAHPGKKPEDIYKMTGDNCTLLRTEVRRMVDRLTW